MTGVNRATATVSTRGRFLEKYFYLFMSLLIPAIIVYGFSHTIDRNLIHPAIPRPRILYLHAVVFSGWVLFFILQSALVQTRNIAWHRRLGWYGAAHGTAIPLVGIATAIIMTRFDLVQLHQLQAPADLIVPLFDMLAFTTTFALAIYWRKRPEFHRRLMLIASCALTAAAFGRFPPNVLRPELFYAGVDCLILLGVIRDWIICRRVHSVYLYALPAFAIGQAIVTYTDIHALPFWLKIANALVR